MSYSKNQNHNSLVFPMLAEVSQGMKGILGLFGKHDQKYRNLANSLVRRWGMKKSPTKGGDSVVFA
jgi:hypothetical protein